MINNDKNKEIIKKWNKDNIYTEKSKLTEDLIAIGLSDEQIIKVLYVIDHICIYCWDNSVGCQCCNDE